MRKEMFLTILGVFIISAFVFANFFCPSPIYHYGLVFIVNYYRMLNINILDLSQSQQLSVGCDSE